MLLDPACVERAYNALQLHLRKWWCAKMLNSRMCQQAQDIVAFLPMYSIMSNYRPQTA